jgi:hypothetical protein
MYTRALADGNFQIELIEAERRFFCSYKWVHGVKFQVICLPNGMIGNVAGKCCSDEFVRLLSQPFLFSGTVMGIRHDQHLCDVARTNDMLHMMHTVHMRRWPTRDTPPFLVLGDSAYAET